MRLVFQCCQDFCVYSRSDSFSLLSASSCISSVSSVHVTWIWFVLLFILPEANKHPSTHGDTAWDWLNLPDKPRLNKSTNKTLSLPFSSFLIDWSQGESFIMAERKILCSTKRKFDKQLQRNHKEHMNEKVEKTIVVLSCNIYFSISNF